MKTRNLLFALALPAAFAACSQDEFATEESGVSLAGRKSIGEITLVTDAQTRIDVNGNKFVFNDEDALSAALIDQPNSGLAGMHDYAYDNYAITDYISSNYKFEKKGGSWSSKAAMVEGNYIFLAPYVNHSVRKPMEATLPAEQNLKLDASGKIDKTSAIQGVLDSKNPVFIAHRFLAADGGTEQGINFYSIYAFPEITVKNTDVLRKPVVVKKVLLRKTTKGGFTLNAPFSNEKVRNALLNEVFAPQGDDTKDQALMGAWAKVASKNFGVKAGYDGKNTKKDGALPTTLELTTLNINGNVTKPDANNQKTAWWNGLTGKTDDLLAEKNVKKGEYIVINFPGNGYTLEHGKSVSFNAVVPAADYKWGEDLELYVVVNTSMEETGNVTKVWKKTVDSRSPYLTLYPGKRYPNQDFNGTDERPNKGGYFTILTGTESDGDVTASKPVDATEFANVGVVTTTEELVAAIANIQSNIKQVIEVNGKNVKFNKAVNDAVANTACQEIEIQGLVYINASECANKTMEVNDRINFRDVVVEEGEVVFEGDANKLGQVFVAPKATLKLKKVITDGTTRLYNAGTLTLDTQVNGAVRNYGELNIQKDLRGANILTYDASCKDEDWIYAHKEIISMPVVLKPSVTVRKNGIYQLVQNVRWPVTIEKGGEMSVEDEYEVFGRIINNGTISGINTNSSLKITSGVEMTNNAGAIIDVKVKIEGATHTLAELKTTPIWPGYYTGVAKVTNSGTMKQDVVVDGLLVMGTANARVDGTISMTAGAEGEINNTAKGVLAKDLDPNNAPVVFATLPLIDVTTKEALEAAKKNMESFIGGAKRVTTFRPRALKVGDALEQIPDYGGVTTLNVGATPENYTIEFVEGSSLTIGETTLLSENIFKVSAKNVVWSGVTKELSKFGLPSATKGLYRTTNLNGDLTATEGNVKFENCEPVVRLQ